ncbi:MAG: hypothetical protein DHS20C18_36180 [Saprospiraceae bacterium]|nr:MAG: hypothetical protein DHS20C18_36180 [Saprospiraceae bacterium]
MTIWEYLLLFLSVMIGGGVGLFLNYRNDNILRHLLSFSGAYILGITVLHMMPGVFSRETPQTSLWILAGFFVQLLLEQLSKGVEHGHIHAHSGAKFGFAFQIMVGLSLHAFLEGLPLSNHELIHPASHNHNQEVNHLLFGIILHKAPAAFALAVLLLQSGFSKSFIIGSTIIFALMSPLGAFSASLFDPNLVIFNNLIALVVGSFLHISTTILFEADDRNQHRISWQKMLVIVAGIGASLLTMH